MHIKTLALFALVAFCACTKPSIPPPPAPPVYTAKTTLKRTLHIAGTLQSDTTYLQGDSVQTKAYYMGSRLVVLLPFDTEKGSNTYRDVLSFVKDTAQLPAGRTGTYSLNSADYPACWITSYSIEFVHLDGYKEFRYAETELGQEVKGEFKIDSYNPATGLISGSYKALISSLAYNMAKSYPVLTTRPASVTIEGTFKDVKLLRD